jgi:hypothetical protein
MGVTLNRTFITENGVHVQNAYVSTKSNSISKQMVDGAIKYIVVSHFLVWVSSQARDGGYESIGNIRVLVETDTPPTGNVYELLYNKLKTMETCTESV